MIRKTAAVFLTAILFLLCSGCESKPKTLRICVDLAFLNQVDQTEAIDLAFYDIESVLKTQADLKDYEVEFIPYRGGERDTALARIRTELMSGGGPDVFITYSVGGELFDMSEEPLFLMPEKVMEAGIFLPLDEYIENAQFTDWDKLTPEVMAAGRNEEGQQLVPLTYTLPAGMFRASDFSHTPTNMTWDEAINDAELHDYAARVGDAISFTGTDFPTDYILGQLADYSEEELCFTEEELLQRATEVLELTKYCGANGFYSTEGWTEGSLGVGMNLSMDTNGTVGYRPSVSALNGITEEDTLSFMPLYSDDGGCTAIITSFAAVNRNTRRPQDAFNVIDCLLMPGKQSNALLYREHIYRARWDSCMPIHEDVMREEYSIYGDWYLSDENFAAMSAVRDQITNAQFAGSLNTVLQDMMEECLYAYNRGEDYTDIVHRAYETMDMMIGE